MRLGKFAVCLLCLCSIAVSADPTFGAVVTATSRFPEYRLIRSWAGRRTVLSVTRHRTVVGSRFSAWLGCRMRSSCSNCFCFRPAPRPFR